MVDEQIADVGDVVWLDFNPQAGHEQAGHRPALVLSPASFNRRRGLMIVCPMTSRIKGNEFEVVVSRDPPSAILIDHVKSIDWRTRRAKIKGQLDPAIVHQVRGRVGRLIGL